MKEWKNSKVIKNFEQWEENINDTKNSLEDLLKRGYLKKYWDKKLKCYKYQTTEEGKQYHKNMQVTINELKKGEKHD